MYFGLTYLLLLFTFINSQNVTQNYANIQWISSNFGSSFSSFPCFYDFNHDGTIDVISLSVDGEIICYDLSTGESLSNSNWPIYLTNDHFFSKPIMYIYGENYNQEVVLIISQKGLIHSFDWKGFLMDTSKIDNIFLNKNWSFINYKSLNELISMKDDISSPDLFHELHPEIYADCQILDLNTTGVATDLIIPVNFVTRNLGTRDVVISAILVFSLISRSLLGLYPLKISLKTGESPGYLLTNFDILDTDSYHLIITSTCGTIYKLKWDKSTKQFSPQLRDPLVYNIGPNKCHLTEFCRSHSGRFVPNDLCCIYSDYYGHSVMMDLVKGGSIWEYEFNDGGIPTDTEIAVTGNNGTRMACSIFATNHGWIHSVSLSTGTSMPSFPVFIDNQTFSSSPKIVVDSKSRLFIMLLSNEGNLYKLPLDQPSNWVIVIHDDQLSSYISPIIMQSSTSNVNSDIIIQSKNGFIFKYEILDLLPQQEERSSRTTMNSISPGYVSTLHGFGSIFSFSLKIHDTTSMVIDPSGYYTVKVFVNEYLYVTHMELASRNPTVDSQIVVDLSRVDRELIPQSVFLFGTVSIRVTNPAGRQFPIDHFYLRINYDFQFELIWIVYLTFSICIFTFLILHFYNDNHRFYIPLYADSNKTLVN